MACACGEKYCDYQKPPLKRETVEIAIKAIEFMNERISGKEFEDAADDLEQFLLNS